MPGLIRLRRAGWFVNRAVLDLGRAATRHWWNPVRRLRREEGLRSDCDPFVRDKFSPDLVLAFFSRWLAQPQRDWPKQTLQPGFVFYDGGGTSADHSELKDFLAARVRLRHLFRRRFSLCLTRLILRSFLMRR